MWALLFIAYIAIGIAQIWAGIVGMHLYFGIGGFLAFIILLVAFSIPLIGTAGVAFITYYGARYGWNWEWWQALLLAVPGIVLMIVAMLTGGLASLFRRGA
jgi:hypothetical protein